MTNFRLSIFLFTILMAFQTTQAARYKGKELDYERYRAVLELDSGKSMNGYAKFKYYNKVTFTPEEGDEIILKIRFTCLDGSEDDVDDCWPRLKVTSDDGDSGVLKIK